MEEIFATIKKIIEIIQQKKNNRLVITEKTHIQNDLDFDFLERLLLLANIEHQFSISIEDIEADSVETIEEIIKLIEYKLEKQTL